MYRGWQEKNNDTTWYHLAINCTGFGKWFQEISFKETLQTIVGLPDGSLNKFYWNFRRS